MRKRSSLLLVWAAAAALAQRPEFEVASVKHNTNGGDMDVRPRRSGDLVTMHNTQPYSVIFYAYGLKARYELAGYVRFTPDEWNWFDIDARIGRDASDDEVRLMFQSLLEDRFKLKVHRETREMSAYELTLAKGKSRLTTASDAPMKVSVGEKHWEQKAGTCGTSMWLEGSRLVCHGVTMEQIAAEVREAMQAPAVDRTGLTGSYDLNVLYMPERQKLREDTVPAPTFMQAFPDATGLKLEKGKGPVEVLVIDRMEKPTENQ